MLEVFYTSPWIPAEWIQAHGLQPRGVWFAPELGGSPLPLSAGVCAFAEAVVRFAERRPEAAVVFTTTCDQLRRSFDALASSGHPRIFLFNMPATWQSPAARRIFHAEVERLGRFLTGLGGCAPSEEKLLPIVAQASGARSRLLEAVGHCSSRQHAEAVARFHWEGSVQLANESAPAPAGSIPLAVVGGPLPASQWSLLDAIEATGARVVLNATEAGERSLLPPLPFEEARRDPPGVLADFYFEHCVDVFQRPNTRLYSWLKERLVARKVRGLVLWHYVGCDLWRAEAPHLREAFGLPVLLLEAEDGPGNSPRQLGRVQAFVEFLK